jgi:hypothetical protein
MGDQPRLPTWLTSFADLLEQAARARRLAIAIRRNASQGTSKRSAEHPSGPSQQSSRPPQCPATRLAAFSASVAALTGMHQDDRRIERPLPRCRPGICGGVLCGGLADCGRFPWALWAVIAVDDGGHQNVLPSQLLLLDGPERAEPQPAWADKIHPGGEGRHANPATDAPARREPVGATTAGETSSKNYSLTVNARVPRALRLNGTVYCHKIF